MAQKNNNDNNDNNDSIILISPHAYYVDTKFNAKNLLNKKVIAYNGEIIGRVKNIIFKETKINGILVKGKKLKIYIDLNYIEKLYADSIMLKINPVSRFIGMKVYDCDGSKLGRVIEIERVSNANTITGIIIKKKFYSKKKKYTSDMIDISTKNIILKNGNSKPENDSRT